MAVDRAHALHQFHGAIDRGESDPVDGFVDLLGRAEVVEPLQRIGDGASLACGAQPGGVEPMFTERLELDLILGRHSAEETAEIVRGMLVDVVGRLARHGHTLTDRKVTIP